MSKINGLKSSILTMTDIRIKMIFKNSSTEGNGSEPSGDAHVMENFIRNQNLSSEFPGYALGETNSS